MKFIDFFAGIGGFRKGMEMAGHECVGFCEFDKFATASYTSMHLITEEQREVLNKMSLKQRQKEILKEEYRNGEWYANDIRRVYAGDIPKANCWCFGAPCQDFSVAGKRAGLNGDRSSLIREIFRLLEEQKEQDRPKWLIYENVKGMFSSNKGLDYLSILSELDRLGYDAEWQIINSKWWVPQNRERVYTIGHLRGRSTSKIFPIQGTDGENSVHLILDGCINGRNSQRDRIYSKNGLCPTIATKSGENTEPKVSVMFNINPSGKGMNGNVYDSEGLNPTLTTNKGEGNKVGIKIIGEINSSQDGQIHSVDGIAKCHSAGHNNSPKIAVPVLTPDRAEKRQNGRRFKENGEPMFTLTGQDRHGVAMGVVQIECSENENGIYVQFSNGVVCYAVWYEKYQCYIAIRKLTTKECFRLQGWTDDYFDKAAFVNSDSQLYKQAGNGVTVNVIYEIAKRLKERDND